MAKEVNKEELELLLKEDKLVVLDLFAHWCGPCKMIAPVMERLSEKYSDRVSIVKVNVDENKEVADKYSIRNIPTVLYIKNGEIVDKAIGAAQESLYVEKIEAALAK